MESNANETSCCSASHAGTPETASHGSGVSDIQAAFAAFMKRAEAPGALDAHTKEAIAMALSILAKCEPCAKIHINKARTMGFTQDEIDEAAWMAISFGGSPLMVWYDRVKKS